MPADNQDATVYPDRIEHQRAIWEPTVYLTMRPATLARGYRQAHARFMDEGRMSRDAEEAFFPIFEALSWAVALDERLAVEFSDDASKDWGWRRRFDGGRVMAGVRFARHRVHHHWADALYLDTRGAQLPAVLPFPFFEWRWRAQLPPGEDSRGENEYRTLLADQPARMALEVLDELFNVALTDRGYPPQD